MTPPGWKHTRKYPLWKALTKRRTRRISEGIGEVRAGTLSYRSDKPPRPISELEESLLIAVTGATGLTMPDRPFQDEKGNSIQATPNLNLLGRSAGSPDNAQATHFFLINDTGTYYLKNLNKALPSDEATPELLIERAREAKVQVLDHRMTYPRDFPYYLDSNRFLSNVEGSTIIMPVVDLSWQYINGLMYLLTQEEGNRPTIVDDRNFYLPAGVRKWIKNGFLNPGIKLPLGVLSTLRTHIEAELLMQNLMLMTEAMGLGGWIHASYAGPFFMGHPRYKAFGKGLGFRYHVPKFRFLDILRWGTFLPSVRANPVGLDGILEANCPPYKSIDQCIRDVVDLKYGAQGVYKDLETWSRIFGPDRAREYLDQVPFYSQDTIDCVSDIVSYIYKTHGRFPAHVDAIYVPGIWLQAHRIDKDYYDKFFPGSYSDSHKRHDDLWDDSIRST